MGDYCSVRPTEWVRGDVVGVGAFGTVNLAMNMVNGELFAVKSVQIKENVSKELVALEKEAWILQKLDSPWILRYLGQDTTLENGVPMRNLFMEYMAGGSVVDILKKFGGRLKESVIRNYTRGILHGIEYLHGKGIVHCDIKGKNVLLGASGVKLADFGSAKIIGDEIGVGVELRGTPLWMAPEVVKQESQGPPSDIWSLGCTVVEMATGKPPWSNTNISHPLVAMYKIGCTDEVPQLPTSLSPQGLDFLNKCLKRDPQERWNASQLLNHPFITESYQAQEEANLKFLLSHSPASPLDFHKVWDSLNCLLWPEESRALENLKIIDSIGGGTVAKHSKGIISSQAQGGQYGGFELAMVRSIIDHLWIQSKRWMYQSFHAPSYSAIASVVWRIILSIVPVCVG